jgi:hypothetical protein
MNVPSIVARSLAPLLLAGLAAATLADDSFVCGSRIVELGLTQAEVLAQCGEPTSKDVQEEAVRSGNRKVGVTQTSRWTYSSYSSSRVLVFDGDKLIGIEDPAGDD